MKKQYNMSDYTDCPVCYEDYTDPKILPCSHTFCLNCLENLKAEKCITCPMCNAEHKVPERGVQAFLENQLAKQLVLE